MAVFIYTVPFFTTDGEPDLTLDLLRKRQIPFAEPNTAKTEFFVSDLWFDMVRYIVTAGDDLQAQLAQDVWIEDFILSPRSCATNERSYTSSETTITFAKARIQFELHPRKFVECLETLDQTLVTRDLCHDLMEYVSRSSATTSCRLKLQSRIWELTQTVDTDISLLEGGDPCGKMTGEDLERFTANEAFENIQTLLQSQIHAHQPDSHVAKKLAKFLPQYVDEDRPHEVRVFGAWRLERLRRLADVFSDQFEGGEAVVMEDLSDHIRELAESQEPLSAVHRQFRTNLSTFVTKITGKKDVTQDTALKYLRDAANSTQEQSTTLSKSMEKMQFDLLQQQQILTYLTYRHVLESLPHKGALRSYYGSEKDLERLKEGDMWQLTWRMAIEKELYVLIHEYIARHSFRDGQDGENLPNNPTIPSCREQLQHLLKPNFEFWASRAGNHDKIMAWSIGNESTAVDSSVRSDADDTSRTYYRAALAKVDNRVRDNPVVVTHSASKSLMPAVTTQNESKAICEQKPIPGLPSIPSEKPFVTNMLVDKDDIASTGPSNSDGKDKDDRHPDQANPVALTLPINTPERDVDSGNGMGVDRPRRDNKQIEARANEKQEKTSKAQKREDGIKTKHLDESSGIQQHKTVADTSFVTSNVRKTLLDSIGLDPSGWNGYKRGHALYSGEMSDYIHSYSELYKVEKHNWSRSDWLVLSWLTPKLNPDTNKPNWDDAWDDRFERTRHVLVRAPAQDDVHVDMSPGEVGFV